MSYCIKFYNDILYYINVILYFQALKELKMLKIDREKLNSQYLHSVQRINELDILPIPQVKQIQNQLRQDLDKVEQVNYNW